MFRQHPHRDPEGDDKLNPTTPIDGISDHDWYEKYFGHKVRLGEAYTLPDGQEDVEKATPECYADDIADFE